jgi:hypothetical protein
MMTDSLLDTITLSFSPDAMTGPHAEYVEAHDDGGIRRAYLRGLQLPARCREARAELG